MNKDSRNLTPKELMISRYEAFKSSNWDYLADTSLHQSIADLQGAEHIEWLKLDVLNAYDNIVEFKAYYKENGMLHLLHEKSRFLLEDGVWKYDDGELFNTKIQRNEPCPCGSGKKFKKCCYR